MRIMVALPYGPGRTRVRARMLLQELAGRHDVTLLGLAWGADDRAAFAHWQAAGIPTTVVEHGFRQRLTGIAGDPRRPIQQAVSTSPAFADSARAMLAEARRSGRPFDVIHVEHLRGAAALDLTRGLEAPVVFDSVDCIADLARLTRRHAPSVAARAIAGYEEGRTRRSERAFVRAASAVTVTAERDRAALAVVAGIPSSRIHVIANGVEALAEPVQLNPAPEIIFTGKLSYHANVAAARFLLNDIWPRVQQEIPHARLTIAGAAAPRWLREHDGRGHVRIVDSPSQMQPLIAGARVAVAPVVYSVGIQNKVLEAMACGVPVVATPAACAGLSHNPAGCLLEANDAEAFAASVVRLLTDSGLAGAVGRAGHMYVLQHHNWADAARQFEALYAGDRHWLMAA